MLCIPIPSVRERSTWTVSLCLRDAEWPRMFSLTSAWPNQRDGTLQRGATHSGPTHVGGGALLCGCEQGTQLFCVKMSPHWHARYNSTVLVSEMWYYPWVAETNQWLSDTGQKIILTRWLSAEWLNMSWNVITEGEKGNERWWIISNKYWESDQLLVIRK